MLRSVAFLCKELQEKILKMTGGDGHYFLTLRLSQSRRSPAWAVNGSEWPALVQARREGGVSFGDGSSRRPAGQAPSVHRAALPRAGSHLPPTESMCRLVCPSELVPRNLVFLQLQVAWLAWIRVFWLPDLFSGSGSFSLQIIPSFYSFLWLIYWKDFQNVFLWNVCFLGYYKV